MKIHVDYKFEESSFKKKEWKTKKLEFQFSNSDKFYHDKSANFIVDTQESEDKQKVRQIIHNFGNSSSKEKVAYFCLMNFNDKCRVDPDSVDGIKAVSISFSVKSDNQSNLTALLLKQNNNLFLGPKYMTRSLNKWETWNMDNIDPKSFYCLGPMISKLDVSKKGAPIYFGYATINSTSKETETTMQAIKKFHVLVKTNHNTENFEEMQKAKKQLQLNRNIINNLEAELLNAHNTIKSNEDRIKTLENRTVLESSFFSPDKEPVQVANSISYDIDDNYFSSKENKEEDVVEETSNKIIVNESILGSCWDPLNTFVDLESETNKN